MKTNVFTYELNEKNLIGDNGEKYISYGVDCFEIENGFKQLVTQIIDVSTDLSKMRDFISRLNASNLSSNHLYNVVEDFICSEN